MSFHIHFGGGLRNIPDRQFYQHTEERRGIVFAALAAVPKDGVTSPGQGQKPNRVRGRPASEWRGKAKRSVENASEMACLSHAII